MAVFTYFSFIFFFLAATQKIYSAEQSASALVEAVSGLDGCLSRAVTCSQIPDYNARAPFADRGKINNVTVAGFNNLLSKHGDYEFFPGTYRDITSVATKYGMPTDIFFSKETKTATITWRRGGMYGFFRGRTKVKVLNTISLPVVEPVQHVRVAAAPVVSYVTQRVGMSQQAAADLLYREFGKFKEITQNFYLARPQYDQVIADLMKDGSASFDTREDDRRVLYLLLKWRSAERIYKISQRYR